MKVAHLITRLIVGGAQENTLHTLEDQHSLHGDEVHLIMGPETGPEGSLLKRAEQGGYPIHIVPDLVRRIAPGKDWKGYRELIALLKTLQLDILHTHSSKAGIIGRAAAAKLRLPIVHTIHGAAFHYGQSPLNYRLYVHAERWAGKRTDHFISVCDAMTEQYLQAGIGKPEMYTTIYSGMDVNPFLSPPRPREVVRQELGLRPHEVVIGKIARMFDLKGHPWLIQAAPEVLRHTEQTRFLLVGDGIHRESYEQQLTELGIRDRFIFTGLVPPTQVPELIHAMDIVVHTSEWEGLARVLPQGAIAGKPVVSFEIDGAGEVVIPGETGYLIPPRDVPALTAALVELVNHPELRHQLGSTGHQRFTEKFRHEFMTSEIRNVYRKVLAEKKNHTAQTSQKR